RHSLLYPAGMLLAAGNGWIWDFLGLLTIPGLVALNALFVAAEFALVSVRRTRVEEMMQQGLSRARALETAINRLDRSIAAVQLGVTLTSIGLGWVGEPVLASLLQPFFSFLEGPWPGVAAHSVATVTAFLFITFMHVTFGELLPKNIALLRPDRI